MKKHLIIVLFIILLFAWGLSAYSTGLNQNQTYIENTTRFSQLVSYFDSGDYLTVVENGPSLLTEEKDSGDILYMIASSHYHLEQYQEANSYFAKAFEAYPYYVENDEVLIQYGISLYQSNRKEDASIIYNQLQMTHISAKQFTNYTLLKSLLDTEGTP